MQENEREATNAAGKLDNAIAKILVDRFSSRCIFADLHSFSCGISGGFLLASLVTSLNLSTVPLKEAKMVTKKKAAKKAGGIQAKLKFNPEWIKDPVPPFFKNLDRFAIRELATAKREFAARVKDILARGQR